VTYTYEDSNCFCAKRLDETWGLFDLYGNPLVTVSGAANLQANESGTLALATMDRKGQPIGTPRVYTLLRIQR
jgi:hypothetical protein